MNWHNELGELGRVGFELAGRPTDCDFATAAHVVCRQARRAVPTNTRGCLLQPAGAIDVPRFGAAKRESRRHRQNYAHQK